MHGWITILLLFVCLCSQSYTLIAITSWCHTFVENCFFGECEPKFDGEASLLHVLGCIKCNKYKNGIAAECVWFEKANIRAVCHACMIKDSRHTTFHHGEATCNLNHTRIQSNQPSTSEHSIIPPRTMSRPLLKISVNPIRTISPKPKKQNE